MGREDVYLWTQIKSCTHVPFAHVELPELESLPYSGDPTFKEPSRPYRQKDVRDRTPLSISPNVDD
jgi:hypothetical protein